MFRAAMMVAPDFRFAKRKPSSPQPPSIAHAAMSRHDLSHYAIVARTGVGAVVQRVPLTDDQLVDQLRANAPIIGAAARNRVKTRWDQDIMAGANCHGWSLNGSFVHADPLPLMTAAVRGQGLVRGKEIAFFLDQHGAVHHSAQVMADGLQHVLIGLGLVRTATDRHDTLGYHERVNGVSDLGRLRDIQHPHQVEHLALDRLAAMRGAVQDAAAHYERQDDHTVHDLLDRIGSLEGAIRGKPYADVIAGAAKVKTLVQQAIAVATGLAPAGAHAPPPSRQVNDLLDHLRGLIPAHDEEV